MIFLHLGIWGEDPLIMIQTMTIMHVAEWEWKQVCIKSTNFGWFLRFIGGLLCKIICMAILKGPSAMNHVILKQIRDTKKLQRSRSEIIHPLVVQTQAFIF